MKLQNVLQVFQCIVTLTLAVEVKIEPSIYKTLEGSGKANIFVSFKKSKTSDLRIQVAAQCHERRVDRINSLYTSLVNHAQETQSSVLAVLSSNETIQIQEKIDVISFWITNQVFIRNADKELITVLSNLDDVSEITEEQIYYLEPSIIETEADDNVTNVQWGVKKIHAPEVWANGKKGAGVVVATIDSGVSGTHESLKDGFREVNGWYDPLRLTANPTDTAGHGTHVMGIIVGRTKGIGVAPEATWISCRGCLDERSCPTSSLASCAQWILCPTDPKGKNPNCELAPHIVSCSWSSSNEHTQMDPVIDTWEAAGIIPIFSAGNSGPICNTVRSPGTNPKVISVGASNTLNEVAIYSSRGPSKLYGTVQPDIVAPGSKITSASHLNDASYVRKSGTDMAAPHVAGLVALLMSEKSNLTFNETRMLLMANAKPTLGLNLLCGGVEGKIYPNNYEGHGRIDAAASIAALNSAGGSSLTIQGVLILPYFIGTSSLIFHTTRILS